MIKPRDVNLKLAGVPFVGMFGHSEVEAAVAYAVFYLQIENRWDTVPYEAMLRHAHYNQHEHTWLQNPMYQPDCIELCRGPFGSAHPDYLSVVFELTPECLQVLQRSPYAPDWAQAAARLEDMKALDDPS